MSEEEIAKLKLELKKEILNELTREEYVKDNTWKTIKNRNRSSDEQDKRI